MEELYPLLAHWKKTGIHKFPRIPPTEFEQIIARHALSIYRKSWGIEDDSLQVYDRLQQEGVVSRAFVQALLELGLENDESVLVDLMRPLVQEGMQNLKKRKMTSVDRAAVRVADGEDYEVVLRELGREVLPQTKGGKRIATLRGLGGQITLKMIHLELRECTKHIRNPLEIPLSKKVEDHDWGIDRGKDIQRYFPSVSELFVDDELALFNSKMTPAQLSLEVIHRRLKTAFPKLKCPTKRGLRNILDKTKIPS